MRANNEAGSYRTFLIADGKPIKAFDGCYYLDWTSNGPEEYIKIPISKSVLPQASQIVYAVTVEYPKTDIDMEQELIGGLFWESMTACTITVE